MTVFWAVCLAAAWALGRLYMPWLKSLPFVGGGIPYIDILAWLGVLAVLVLLLMLFRRILHWLFWRELNVRGLRA